MRALARRIRLMLADGGLARTVIWFVVLVLLLDSWERGSGQADHAIALMCVGAFLAWEVTRDRLGGAGSLIGLALVAVGMACDEQLAMVLGLPVLAVSLAPLIAVAATLLSLLGYAWASSSDVPARLLPTLLLGLFGFALMLYLLLRISATARHLRETREDLARTEVDAERDRLAAELNRIIGQTLHQVARQTAEARESIHVADPRVQAQLADVEKLVDRGLEQLKLLSFEPVIDDLDAELQTAQILCPRLGVDFTGSIDPVDEEIGRVFALLLREAVTNMFKHAIPTRCTLVIREQDGEALFSFTNDGAPAEGGPTRSPVGSGQRRWAAATDALGGTLETGSLTGGRYRVVARVPVPSACEIELPGPRESRPRAPRPRALQRSSHG